MNVKLLNEIKDKMVEFANENDILLAEHFDRPDEFKRFVVLFSMRAVMDHGGKSVEEAFDMVMGEGEYDKLAESVWEELNKKEVSNV